MHTLGKKITSTFFTTEDGFDALRAHWSASVQDGVKMPAYLYLLYAILRGKDYRKGFAEVKNPVKIENGQDPHQGLTQALSQLNIQVQLAPHELVKAMGGTISVEGLRAAMAYLPTPAEVKNGKTIGAHCYFVKEAKVKPQQMSLTHIMDTLFPNKAAS